MRNLRKMLRRLKAERKGAILLAAIVLMVFAFMCAVAVITYVYSTSKTSSNKQHHMRALEIAETGLNQGALALNTTGAALPTKITFPTGQTHQQLLDWLVGLGSSYYKTDGSYKFFLTTDSSVIGLGVDGKNRRAVRCHYTAYYFPGADAPSALYIDANTVDATYNGTSFLVDGRDHTLDGTPILGNAKPGVVTTTPTATTGVIDALSKAQLNKNVIKGSTPSPSVVTTSPPPIDINAFSDQLTPFADYVYNQSSSPTFPALSSYGAADYPVTVIVNGDVNVTGNLVGYGILVIKGNLSIGGTVTWRGIVIVYGNGEWAHGTPDIIGSMWIKSTAATLRISGDPAMLYSSQAITQYGTPGTRLEFSTWEEL
jgi:hypothetical protein